MHGRGENVWRGGKQKVLLRVSQFPRDLRICCCCARSEQQGCVWCKKLRKEASIFCTFVVLRESVELILLQLQARSATRLSSGESVWNFFFLCFHQNLSWLLFQKSLGRGFKEVFLINSSFARWSTMLVNNRESQTITQRLLSV